MDCCYLLTHCNSQKVGQRHLPGDSGAFSFLSWDERSHIMSSEDAQSKELDIIDLDRLKEREGSEMFPTKSLEPEEIPTSSPWSGMEDDVFHMDVHHDPAFEQASSLDPLSDHKYDISDEDIHGQSKLEKSDPNFNVQDLSSKQDHLRDLLALDPLVASSEVTLNKAANSPDQKADVFYRLSADDSFSHLSDCGSTVRTWFKKVDYHGLKTISSMNVGLNGQNGELASHSNRQQVSNEVLEDRDLNNRPKKIRHKKRVNGKKICLVCGDKALAHNFDVITCESCKAFFRRNALKPQNTQRCMFQSNCVIDKNTRRFCPSCRLKKCFDIGMNAELILDDEERRLRQEKKAQRIIERQAASSSTHFDDSSDMKVESSASRLPSSSEYELKLSPDTGSMTGVNSSSPDRRQPSSVQSSPLPSFYTLREAFSPSFHRFSPFNSVSRSFNNSSPIAQSFSSDYTTVKALLSKMSATQSEQTKATFSKWPGHFYNNKQTTSVNSSRETRANESPQSSDLPSSNNQEGLSLTREDNVCKNGSPYTLPGPGARIFTHILRDRLPSDPFMYWIVTSEERLMLANLTTAYQDVLLTLTDRGVYRNVPISDTYFLDDFLNEIDRAMYSIVQFSKHISDFRLVPKDDQIAMLKASAMQTLGIACCAVYVHERDCWLSLRGDLTLSHLRKLTNDDPYIQIGVEYCRSVKSLVKNDFTVYALIHCMILFDPRDAKIVARQLINQARDKYVIMLKHYLESQYSYLFADEYFVAIQERVREMCHLAQSGNAFYKRYSSAFQPLIAEILSSS